jgi:hypothetical protein
VVVLNEDERVFTRGFFNDCIGEAPIDSYIGMPVRPPEDGTHERYVTHRPQSLIGKPVIISLLFLTGEPDPPEGVLRMARRYMDAIVCINGVSVRRAAAVGNPLSTTSTHYRLKCCDHAACWELDLDSGTVGLVVDVGLAIGNCDHFAVAQPLLKQLLKT